jgi:hypothetical protein
MTKDNLIISKEITAEMNKLFDNVDTCFNFDKIERIDASQADEIQNKICGHTSRFYDRLCLQKYFYLQKFDANVNIEKLGLIWDMDYFFFFEKYDRLMKTENVFKEIKISNDWNDIFPTGELKTIKIEDTTLDKIFKLYNFRTISKSSSKKMIFKEIMNTTFDKQIILIKYDANKHASYYLSTDLEYVYDDLIESYKHFIQPL